MTVTVLLRMMFAAGSVLILSPFCHGQVRENSSTDPEKIRAGYMYANNFDIPLTMAQNGMNLALVKFGVLHAPIRPKELELLSKWSKLCRQADIKFMPVINFWQYEKEWIKPQYHLYYGSVELSQTPCPLEAQVYNLTVHKRVLELARLSRSIPIAGVVIDLEMYGADTISYPDYCLCNHCFEKFFKGKLPHNLPSDKRQAYLLESGQVNAYRSFTVDSIEQLAETTRKQLELIAPDFMTGALRLDRPGPYNMGLARGLGKGRNAVLVFTEQTYNTGYSDYIRTRQKSFQDQQINARLVVGLWQNKFPPENLAEQCYHCAKDSAGYWIYTLQSLSDRSRRALPFDKQLYWQAIAQANKQLQALESNPQHQSNLQIRDFQSIPKPLDTDGINIPSLQYVQAWDSQLSKPAPFDLQFRGKVRLVFTALEADQLKFEVALKKFGPYRSPSAFVAITDSSGQVLARELASAGRPARLQSKAPYTGSYALIFNSDVNLATLLSYSHPLCVDMSDGVAVFRPQRSLYFYKPAGRLAAKVYLAVDGFGESVVATFRDEAGRVLAVRDIVGHHTVTVPLGSSWKDEIIELQIQPRPPKRYFEDVRIKVQAGLGKYASSCKEDLLKTAN